jgi:D-methionine transport system ATP-binding protein
MIQLTDVTKTFETKKGRVEALNSVSLEVKKGEIFGVVGYSGAGKSTLIRCVNLLERPTQGTVTVGGQELTALSPSQLRQERKRIGMIFQGFHLLKTATVQDNIAIPLRLAGHSRAEVQRRVDHYLEIVGLSDRKEAYPAQLSGGQKQRVAIARALSHEPEVLLSDEATSALDPDTTESILSLLRRINEKLGITILLITHEMAVIQKVCDRMAVMESGTIVESGDVLSVFSNAQHPTTKKFINSLFPQELPPTLTDTLKESGPVVTLSFVGDQASQPTLATVAKEFRVYPNILSGNITPLKHQSYGRLTVHLQGHPEETGRAIQFLKEQEIRVEGVEAHVDTHQRIS